MRRRAFVLLPVLAALAQRAWAKLQPTPSQAEGPFYPVQPIPLNNDLVHHDGGIARGEHLELRGVLRRSDGSPIADALIEIWQCDAAGRYRHPGDQQARVDKHFAGFGATRTARTSTTPGTRTSKEPIPASRPSACGASSA